LFLLCFESAQDSVVITDTHIATATELNTFEPDTIESLDAQHWFSSTRPEYMRNDLEAAMVDNEAGKQLAADMKAQSDAAKKAAVSLRNCINIKIFSFAIGSVH
jgi:hypothetical protein